MKTSVIESEDTSAMATVTMVTELSQKMLYAVIMMTISGCAERHGFPCPDLPQP